MLDLFLAGTRTENGKVAPRPKRLGGGFHLYELNEVIANHVNVVGDLTSNTLNRFVPQHLGDVVGRDTILEDEAVLGSDSAGIIRFHFDIHDKSGHGIHDNHPAPSIPLVAH